jgi:hypothetical protein
MQKQAAVDQVSIARESRNLLDEIQSVRRRKGAGRRETSARRLTEEAIGILHKRVCK